MRTATNYFLINLLHLISMHSLTATNCNEGIDLLGLSQCKNNIHVNSDTKTDTIEKQSRETAVIPYIEDRILPMHKDKRTFMFENLKVVIHQNWHEGGLSGIVWDAAICLCEYLIKNQNAIYEKEILELGAGTGLVGIVATHLGGNVTLTERTVALDHLKKNVMANIDPSLNSARVMELDWTLSHLIARRSYDVILGADIVYEEEGFDSLLSTLIRFSDRNTSILISVRIRYDRDERFLEMLNEVFTKKIIHTCEDHKVQIYLLAKK